MESDTKIPIKKAFIGYEYREIAVAQLLENVYADSYENFGWELEDVIKPAVGLRTVTLKFKRNRKIRNKAELTRLQRQFDSCLKEILQMEQSKGKHASIVAYTVGVIGTAFMAGATFAAVDHRVAATIILAVPAFLGWILPYFLYTSLYAKKDVQVTPLIESKYDEAFEVCERANSLL